MFRFRQFALFVLGILWLVPATDAREITLTFDDAPRGDGRVYSGEARTRALIAALERAGVPGAMFFAVGRNVDASGRERLARYAAAGHVIANHSQTHQSPQALGLEGYLADVRQADGVLRDLEGFQPYFRFPFLNEGRESVMRDGLREGLLDLGYRQGYVTVDNYDWYMEALLQQALEAGREVDFAALGALYVALLLESVAFYDAIAVETLGRSPRHVLLLHENDLAALYVEDLVAALRGDGWTVVSALHAYADPLAGQLPDTLFLGQGRVAALAAEAGRSKPSLVHESEDEDWLEQRFEAAGVFGPAPAWSPFDETLLYSDNADGVTRVMLRDGARGAPRTLTSGDAGGNYPVPSPDGHRIAFQRRDAAGQLDVWLMNADGSEPRRLTTDPAHDYLPAWRPASDQLVFLSRRAVSGNGDSARYYMLDLVDLEQRSRPGEQPFSVSPPGTSAPVAWSPDGTFLILTRSTGEGAADLYLAAPDGTVQRRLTDDERYNGSPSVSPDGRHIAFYSQGGSHSRIEVMGVDGNDREVIVGQGLNWSPHWSPDGAWLLFSRSMTADHSDTDLFVVPARPGARPRVLVSGPGRQAEASWAPR